MRTFDYQSFLLPPVHIPADGLALEGELRIPPHAKGIVIFAHGSGSSRLSPRNQFVAQKLQHARYATLLVDLLSDDEGQDYQNRFDIPLLAERVTAITDWATHDERTEHLPVGYFATSTGAAAAIIAAANAADTVRAIVACGGRVDLAGAAIEELRVPAMLIVGQRDYPVREANMETFRQLHCIKRLALIRGATHLFTELGALERVTALATKWFNRYLQA